MLNLTKREESVLIAVCRLRDNAYGITIRKMIRDVSGRSINYGSLCNTLNGLIGKGYLISGESEPDHVQGGRRKVIYSLTEDGKAALKNAYQIHQNEWTGIKDFILGEE